ncbi:endoglucanase A-like [Saccoglossus kowalevskii]|uniref:Endoglucanase n=1 Tax=Saccoglossus kowalevskii TaxID=10224 RepID=A0ABM0GLZ8_SACKO|nr:PREDICTED: endoglucanase-like [Saccoglossus kowalevskii]
MVIGAIASQSFDSSVIIRSRWKKQFIGTVEVDVLEKVTDGWSIHLNFSTPVTNLQVWDAELVSSDSGNYRHVLCNTLYNSDLEAGKHLHLMLMGNVDEDKLLTVDVSMSHEPLPVAEAEEQNLPGNSTTYDYNMVLHLSILFYEAQRSGHLPSTTRVPWRYDSALYDMGKHGEDLTGGYYDAGDHLKFTHTNAYAASVLAWGLIEYVDAYEAGGMVGQMLDTIRWATDYLIKSHTGLEEFYYMVGDANDHAYWGRPEDMTMIRPASVITPQNPGTEPCASAAAALAAAAIAFRDTDSTYSDTMTQHAKELYDLGNNYRLNYNDNGFYKSGSYADDLCWAAIWLYRATSEQRYLDDAEQHYIEFELFKKGYSFAWGDVKAGCQLMLFLVTNNAEYYNDFVTFMDGWLPGGTIPYTDNGLVFRDEWGSLRYAGGASWIALVAADNGIRVNTYREFAKSQIGYILGDTGRSYLIGFGKDYPHYPHHRSSSCPKPPDLCTWGNAFGISTPNYHVLYGGLVGGPTDLSDTYTDSRENYFENEVAIDYNAGFQSAVAALQHLKLTSQL